ncbi:sensor histidine kinase [Bacillus sp. JJ1764]|uniref:sensor histidine kinase n=1 Tax=Bacillus sp. JJ1764 TaxID=3122964 RepID=UPI002FFEE45E
MHSISKRLSILMFICTFAAILLITLFVNITVTSKFNQYMVDIQNNRYQRIVTYFEDAYKRDGKWTENTGIELMHEAYMGNYCLTLMDQEKKPVWGMNPKDIKKQMSNASMPVKNTGVYTTKTFKINVNHKKVGYVSIGQYSSVLLTEEDQNFKASINKSIVVSAVITLFIIVCLSLYFSKQFSIPIREVAKMSVRLSGGNYHTEIHKKSNIKELEDLRNSINVLASKLKYQDTLRKRLVSDISHEIRTPLNVLQNNLEAMIDGVFPVTTEKLSYLNEEVIRFGKLVNNLNLLKEFESEGAKFHYEITFLDEIITDTCNQFYLVAEQKDIKLQYSIQPNNKYRVFADKDQLKQVFINLISNSLKFTKKGGTILVNLYETDHEIVAEVIDNGIGIEKEDLPYIFERLYRGDMSRNQIEGTGIGLTIVKNILEHHNAISKIESDIGKGTRFTIFFQKTRV